MGAGTQKVEDELGDLFPEAEVLRMDADTASAGHEALLQRFVRQRIPILLGTQMVAKGLDFDNVTLVGVLAADLSLYADNYRAAERTFNLLTQVVGRAGRGAKGGRAVIQTYTPENDVIQCAAAQDYRQFYAGEIRMAAAAALPALCRSFYRDRFRGPGGKCSQGRRFGAGTAEAAVGPTRGAGPRACARIEGKQPLSLPLPSGRKK